MEGLVSLGGDPLTPVGSPLPASCESSLILLNRWSFIPYN